MIHGRVHIDRFSAGLDDLSKKDQRDDAAVLRVLKRTGRFSAFEASDNEGIAATVTRLLRDKLIESIGGEYPWTKVLVTAAGEAVLQKRDKF